MGDKVYAINEQGDLGLWMNELSENDQKLYDDQKKKEDSDKKEDKK